MRPRIINLPQITDERGNLSFFESQRQVPFNISSVKWLTGFIPDIYETTNISEFLVSVSGQITFQYSEQGVTEVFTLDSPKIGLYIPKKCTLKKISEDPCTLVVACNGLAAEKTNQSAAPWSKI